MKKLQQIKIVLAKHKPEIQRKIQRQRNWCFWLLFNGETKRGK